MSDNKASTTPPQGPGTLALAGRLLGLTLRGHRARMVAGMLLLLGGTAMALLQPWPLKWIIDVVLMEQPAPGPLAKAASALSAEQPRMAMLVLLCSAMLLIDLVMAGLTLLNNWLLVGLGLRMVFNLRCALFTHMQRLSLRFHDNTTVGDSLYRVTWDSYCVQAVFNSGLVPALGSVLTLMGVGAIVLAQDWLLAVAVTCVAVPLGLLIRWLDRPMSESSMRVHERESEISTRVQEALGGIRAVQAFGREEYETQRFRSKAESSLQANLRLTVIQTAFGSVSGLVLSAGIAGIVLIGGWRVIQGRLTPGDVVLMLAYMRMISGPLNTLAYTAAVVQGAVAGARRVFGVLDSQPAITDAPDAAELTARPRGQIAFEGVRFAYADDRDVLKDVDLTVPAGMTVALVGPSGAGKTTLVSLIMRFYDPSHGRVTLDGQDLRKLKVASLRSNVALVLQDPVLFACSIRENIAYGRPGATHEQIEAATKAAGAHDFILALPEGYDTQIGERGVNLSGGQKQRLAIARTFLKDAPVLILDEPTSALDATTEMQLLAALERLKAGRTTFIIAHRLSTIRNANLIVAMKDGRIAEVGPHEELLARDGLYAELYRAQFAAMETSGSGT